MTVVWVEARRRPLGHIRQARLSHKAHLNDAAVVSARTFIERGESRPTFAVDRNAKGVVALGAEHHLLAAFEYWLLGQVIDAHTKIRSAAYQAFAFWLP